MQQQPILISVSGQGTAKAKFTSVGYSVSVNANGKTGPAAKKAAKPTIEKIRTVIAEHAKSAELDTTRLTSDFHIQKVTEYDPATRTNKHGGYLATYSVSFTGKNVEAATAVHDVLTSIEGAEADSPQFRVEASSTLEAKAFADAVAKAQKRFADQCKALSLDPSDYAVASWTTREDQPNRGKMMALAAEVGTAGDEPVQIEPGKAEFRVNVTVSFTHKKKQVALTDL